jgi:hypothetical protein
MASAPPLEQVLANVVRGRDQRLRLSERQRRGLDDRDGRIALQVLRALVRARKATCPPMRTESFPLTEDAFQAIARRLGLSVGDKRARAIIKRCITLGVLESAGSYRQRYRSSSVRSGFRVPLYRLGTTAAAKRKASVGKRSSVKRFRLVRWWAHPLFGEPNGRPPPHLALEAARRMRSIDEFEMGLGRRSENHAQKRAKPLVVGQRTELRDGREFKLLVLEPATRDHLLDVDGLTHFPPPKGWRWQRAASAVNIALEASGPV